MSTCYACQGRPPRCGACVQLLIERWRDNARMFGKRWGAGLVVARARANRPADEWPAWGSDRARRVRRACRRIASPLASTVPERRDPRLVEAFAKICAEAAAEAYTGLSLADARALITAHDRQHPS